jgi:hypothetical protein
MFTTRNGYIGMDPGSIRQGDEVYEVAGSNQPLILRSEISATSSLDTMLKSRLYHLLIGPCYVHGIMDGEIVQDLTEEPSTLYVK